MNKNSSRPIATLVGPYQILEKLGRGGMASVYRARHTRTDQIVALKISSQLRLAELSPVAVKRFQREFAVASKLHHPNLVRAFECGEIDGKLYLAIEYVAGRDLSVQIKEKGPLPLDEALAIFRGIGEAVRYLHQHQILHRDIKPANILLTAGLAKLADLGLVKSLSGDSQLTRSHSGLGTLEYGAPEQFEDAKDADVRCDLYSLAATFYHAITGEFPFGTGGHIRILRRKLSNSFLPLSEKWPGISPVLDHFVTRALQFKREHRPASADEFLAALEHQSRQPFSMASPSTDLLATEAEPGTTAKNRRAAVRHPVTLKGSCEPMFEKGRQTWTATIADLSEKGCCLSVPCSIPQNSYLQLHVAQQGAASYSSHLAQVCWVEARDTKHWTIGCRFLQSLPLEQLQRLLEAGTATTVFIHHTKGPSESASAAKKDGQPTGTSVPAADGRQGDGKAVRFGSHHDPRSTGSSRFG